MFAMRRQLRFVALCVISLCFLRPELAVFSQSQGLLLQCVFLCLGSPSCGWVSQNPATGQCRTHDFIDCNTTKTDMANNILMMYSRQPSAFPVISTARNSLFNLFNTTDTTCISTMTSCGIPVTVANVFLEYRSMFPGSVVKYRCSSGFSFCGPTQKEVKCLANGTWENVGDGCFQTTWTGIPPSPPELGCPVTFRTGIEIIGTPTQNTKFSFALFGLGLRIVFYFEVRFDLPVVVLNTRNSTGGWETSVSVADFPFQVGRQFNVTLHMNSRQYEMWVDGVYYTSFTHRYSIDEIHAFSFWGDVDLRQTEFNF